VIADDHHRQHNIRNKDMAIRFLRVSSPGTKLIEHVSRAVSRTIPSDGRGNGQRLEQALRLQPTSRVPRLVTASRFGETDGIDEMGIQRGR